MEWGSFFAQLTGFTAIVIAGYIQILRVKHEMFMKQKEMEQRLVIHGEEMGLKVMTELEKNTEVTEKAADSAERANQNAETAVKSTKAATKVLVSKVSETKDVVSQTHEVVSHNNGHLDDRVSKLEASHEKLEAGQELITSCQIEIKRSIEALKFGMSRVEVAVGRISNHD